jgi:hypothetical protein
MTAPTFRTGGAAAEVEAEKSKGSKFARLAWFKLDPDEKIVVRFLTDSPEWIFVKQHTSVPTKNPPADFKGKWPTSMPAVCRKDPAFAGMYADCYVCDTPVRNPRDDKPIKQALRVWALAAVREEVRKDGIVVGYKDAEIEYTVKEGEQEKTVTGKHIVVVNQGMQNFFSSLQGIYGLNNTICDRDFLIQRRGEGLDTDYTIFPVDRVPGEDRSNAEFWGGYEKALATQNIDLGTIVGNRADDDYYGRFFDPRVTVPSQRTSEENTTTASAPAPSAPAEDQPTAEDLEAMRARLASYSG